MSSLWKKVVVSLLVLLAVERFVYFQTEGFQLAKVISDISYERNADPRSPGDEREILKQRFYFLKRGKQSYNFVSEDGKVVLKLFKQDLFPQFAKLISSIVPPLEEALVKSKLDRERRYFASAELADKELRAECGIIYAHLNPTEHLKTPLIFTDKLGITFKLESDDTPFVLQKRGVTLKNHLTTLTNAGKNDEAALAITEVAKAIKQRCARGIRNADLHRDHIGDNFGILEGSAIEIDIGKFVRDVRPKDELARAELHDLQAFLEKHFPNINSREL